MSKQVTAFMACPECGAQCAPSDTKCWKCGFSFKREAKSDLAAVPLDTTIHFDKYSMHRYTYTRPTSASAGMFASLTILGGAFGLIIGGGLGVLGIIVVVLFGTLGLCIGIPILLIGVIILISGFASGLDLKGVEGCCPNCGEVCKISISYDDMYPKGKCGKCYKLFSYRDSKFEEWTAIR